MQYNLTISVWLIGHLERNERPVSKPRHLWTPDEQVTAMQRSAKMGHVLGSLQGIKVRIATGMNALAGTSISLETSNPSHFLPGPPCFTGSEPHEQVSMTIQQRHLKRLVPYLARVCKDHGIHAIFDLQTVARFNPACDKCGKVDRRNEFRNWASTDRFVCKKCRVQEAMEINIEYALQHHLKPVQTAVK